MNKTYYVCKYTPIELLEAFGGECQNLNEMPQGFDHADQIAHPNICGFEGSSGSCDERKGKGTGAGQLL